MQYYQKWKCIPLVLVLKAIVTASDREFVLNKLVSCRGGPYSMQFNIKAANMTKNHFTLDGEVVVTTTQSKDLLIVLKYRRCEMKKDKKCGGSIDYVLPKVCSLVSDSGGVFGMKLNRGLVPKWDCPVKANTYKVQIDFNLKTIALIPFTNTLYETKVVFQDAGKKKVLGCIEGVYWVKDK